MISLSPHVCCRFANGLRLLANIQFLFTFQVDESFEAAEGAQLSGGLLVGKHCGSGSTADVYKLQRSAGKPGAELVG